MNSSVKSEQTYFRFTQDPTQLEQNEDLERTGIDGVVRNHRQISLPGVTILFERIPEGEDKTEFEMTIQSGNNGRFTINSLPPGRYKVFAEKAYADFYNTYETYLDVLPGIVNELRIVMENNEGRLMLEVKDDEGRPVRNAKLKVTNSRYTWEARTGGDGKYTFLLPDGVYNFEVEKVPFFSRYFENNVQVTGETLKAIELRTTTAGAARMNVIEGGSLRPLGGYKLQGTKQ